MLIIDYRLRCGSRTHWHRKFPDPQSSEAGSLSSGLDSLTVIWLEVTMDHVGVMGCLQSNSDLQIYAQNVTPLMTTFRLPLQQSFSLDILHRNMNHPICFIYLVDGHDVRMRDAGRSASFTKDLETLSFTASLGLP